MTGTPMPTDTSVHREITLLKETLTSKIDASDRITAQRFDSVQKQLDVADRYRVEQKTDTATMTQAALAAAEKAVQLQTTASSIAIAKSEASTTKQIEQAFASFTASLTSVIEKVNNVIDRVSKIEANKLGGSEVKANFYAFSVFVVGAVGTIMYFVGKG